MLQLSHKVELEGFEDNRDLADRKKMRVSRVSS